MREQASTWRESTVREVSLEITPTLAARQELTSRCANGSSPSHCGSVCANSHKLRQSVTV